MYENSVPPATPTLKIKLNERIGFQPFWNRGAAVPHMSAKFGQTTGMSTATCSPANLTSSPSPWPQTRHLGVGLGVEAMHVLQTSGALPDPGAKQAHVTAFAVYAFAATRDSSRENPAKELPFDVHLPLHASLTGSSLRLTSLKVRTSLAQKKWAGSAFPFVWSAKSGDDKLQREVPNPRSELTTAVIRRTLSSAKDWLTRDESQPST